MSNRITARRKRAKTFVQRIIPPRSPWVFLIELAVLAAGIKAVLDLTGSFGSG